MDNSFYSDPKQLNENRLPARASVVPAQRRGINYEHKYESSFFLELDGDYKFRYEKADIAPDFYKTDIDDSTWDTLPVPAMWEYNGYGLPVYPNVEYPFPFNPPYINIENPVGYYRKHFVLEEIPERSVIHFDGVDNNLALYINGKFAGCAKNVRMATEFDVTPFLQRGDNLIAIKVKKYSDASYLENQDMLLASGIFRDIYLINTKKESIWDYYIKTDMSTLECTVYLADGGNYEGCEVVATLENSRQSASIDGNTVNFTFAPQNIRLWNAETPNLYELTLELVKNGEVIETHYKRVGFRESHVANGKMYVNNTPITIKGINRHEHNCKAGRNISVEQIHSELELIKECHINAIRCSHYPNHPAFYDIASELGIYVMDEADCESHGCGVTGDQGFISKQPYWLDAYLDRTKRMVYRDRNETCVVIWSTGNEVGKGDNVDACGEWLCALPERKPVRMPGGDTERFKCEFAQMGYCIVNDIKNKLEQENGKRPLMLTEYAHSMGNGPGALKDYWDLIYHNEYLIGGYGWEFKSHGYYVERNGRGGYLFGGDFGDINSWSNFTIDGFCFSDGRKKPAICELAEAHAPLWVDTVDGEVYLMNTNDFLNLDTCEIGWSVLEDASVIACGKRKMDSVLPHQSVRFDDWKHFDGTVAGARYRLDIILYSNGREAAHKQVDLGEKIARECFKPTEHSYKISQNGQTVSVNDGKYDIRFENGMLSYFAEDGKEYITEKAEVNFFRAPTDNDGIVKLYPRHIAEWESVLLDTFKYFPDKITTEVTSECVKVKTSGKILPQAKYAGFITEIDYYIYASGIILTNMHCAPYGNMPPYLPRIGVVYPLNKRYDTVAWYGRGKTESYNDRALSTPIGRFEENIADMNVLYDVPQENGNHFETGYAIIKDGSNIGFGVIGCPSFEFSYHGYTLENLTKARHTFEIEEADKNYLYVDYKMRGVGSRSCGPDPEPQYELYPHEFEFAHVLMADTDEKKALELTRKAFAFTSRDITSRYEKVPMDNERALFECKE